ncbi:MAG TPA: phosphoribosylformylglycinamidine synthase subunit PurL [Planctomycetaceae bacterium]|nr:phosphoribosylformylglycinamidine synthase subunit PurL [Planctomycetaceae bacterium]
MQKLGVDGIIGAQVANLYFLRGNLSAEAVDRLCVVLLYDPVTEAIRRGDVRVTPTTIEIGLLPGVTDPVAEEILRAARLLGVEGLEQVATGLQVTLYGDCDQATLHRIARRLLCNEAIQYYTIGKPLTPSFLETAPRKGTVETIPLHDLDDDALLILSRERALALNIAEMRAIQRYFADEGRDPTDVELETLAQTWSEHCVHKTFKAEIECRGEACLAPTTVIDGLLDTFIRRATEEANKPWVQSAFVDNAGIIRFDDEFDLAFKVETHNHPSALEPFGGANTGVGGVVRDILGVSARPIAVTDVLCFGPQEVDFAALPEGVLHPRRIADGVIAGIEDYGNKLGLPTVSGAILYDDGYLATPLVYCGCLGLLPRDSHVRAPQPGDRIVVIGGRTGRDGLRGATFSSATLAHDTGDVAGTVVQIGNPITEKQALEVVTEARERGLYHAITDCGAGGLSSAVGEMGAELGAEVELMEVALKYAGLQPWEIWLSEAQERMVLAVPPENIAALQSICERHGVLLTDIGAFTDTGRLAVRYAGRVAADLDMAFLHHSLPRRRMRAVWTPPDLTEPDLPPIDPAEVLLQLLAHPTIASKEDVIRRYDHEVRGGTVVKPLVGIASDGPSDAVVLYPLVPNRQSPISSAQSRRGIALSLGIHPLIGRIDPYAMAWAAVDEAVRNAVAVGADPEHIALLDNFCWGNPEDPEQLGGLVRAAMGCYDGARAFDLPFISGKDSLNNEYVAPDGARRPVPGTLLISAVGIVPDIRRCVTMDAKAPGNGLYLVGTTRRELGGSYYLHLLGRSGGTPPAPPDQGAAIARALHAAMREGLVRACHDLSEGGLAVAAAEMAIAGRLGLHLDLRALPRTPDVDRDDIALFAESLSRYLVEVAPEDAAAFEARFADLPIARIGAVTADNHLTVVGLDEVVVRLSVESLKVAWQRRI